MIPVETLEHCNFVPGYRLQDIEKARQHRDRLKADGKNAFLIRSEGRGRYDGTIHVCVPRSDKSA
jgi:hypothetical protein